MKDEFDYGDDYGDDYNQKLLSTIRRHLTDASSAYSECRNFQIDDLDFFIASPDNRKRWPTDVLSTRTAVNGQSVNARPCLTINKVQQHVRQITNDQKENRPSIKVIPSDEKSDIRVAEIFNEVIRHIEYVSAADVAYDTACENQVILGEGYIRLITDYTSDSSFEQELKISRIRNSFSVYMDPNIQDPCGSDA